MKKHKSGKRFRSTLGGGYKKEDVNAYIEEIQAEFVSVEATLKGQIDRQSAQVHSAEEANAAAKAELAALRERIAALEGEQTAHIATAAELSSLRAEYETLRGENHALSAENTALVEKQQALAAEYLALQTEKTAIEEGELAELRDKAAAFDRMSADFGAIMLRANENAEAIVRSAKARAQATSEGLIGTLDGRLRKINADCRDDILAELEDLRVSVGAMLASMKTKYADIGARIDHAKTEMQSERDRVLHTAPSLGFDFIPRNRKK